MDAPRPPGTGRARPLHHVGGVQMGHGAFDNVLSSANHEEQALLTTLSDGQCASEGKQDSLARAIAQVKSHMSVTDTYISQLGRQLSHLMAEKAAEDGELARLRSTVPELRAQAEKDRATHAEREAALQTELASSRAELAHMAAEADTLRQNHEMEREALASALRQARSQSASAANVHIDKLQSHVADIRTVITEQEEDLVKLDGALASEEAEHQNLIDTVSAIREHVRDLEEDSAAQALCLKEAESDLVASRQEATKSLTSLQQQKAQLDAEVRKSECALVDANHELASAKSRELASLHAMSKIQEALATTRHELERSRRQLRDTNATARKAEQSLASEKKLRKAAENEASALRRQVQALSAQVATAASYGSLDAGTQTSSSQDRRRVRPDCPRGE